MTKDNPTFRPDAEQTKADLVVRGSEIIKGTSDSVYKSWQRLRHGADAFMGTMYDGDTKETIANTGSMLKTIQVDYFGHGNYDFARTIEQTGVAVVDGIKQPMEVLTEGSEIKVVSGPAEHFDDEIKELYTSMVSATGEEAKRLALEIFQRISAEKENIGEEERMLLNAGAEVVRVVDSETKRYEAWHDADTKGEGVGDIVSFEASLHRLQEASVRNNDELVTQCKEVKSGTEDLETPWVKFIVDYFDAK